MSHCSDEEQLAAECYALAHERNDQETMRAIFVRAEKLPQLTRYLLAIHRGAHGRNRQARVSLEALYASREGTS